MDKRSKIKLMRKKKKLFPWLRTFYSKYSEKFFSAENREIFEYLFLNLENEMKDVCLELNNEKSENFYNILNSLFLHFWWQIRWKSCKKWETYWEKVESDDISTNDSHGEFCVQLLYYMILLSIILTGGDENSAWIDRILTTIKSLPDATDILCSALLLTSNLKKKHKPVYSIILRHILCSETVKNATEPQIYCKVILLFRRLLKLTKDKKEKAGIFLSTSKLKVPCDIQNWLTSQNIEDSSDLNYNDNLTQELLSRSYPDELLGKLSEVLTEPNVFQRKSLKISVVDSQDVLSADTLIEDINSDLDANYNLDVSLLSLDGANMQSQKTARSCIAVENISLDNTIRIKDQGLSDESLNQIEAMSGETNVNLCSESFKEFSSKELGKDKNKHRKKKAKISEKRNNSLETPEKIDVKINREFKSCSKLNKSASGIDTPRNVTVKDLNTERDENLDLIQTSIRNDSNDIKTLSGETNVNLCSESSTKSSKKRKRENEESDVSNQKKEKKDEILSRSSKDYKKSKKKSKDKQEKKTVKINGEVVTYSKPDASSSDFGVKSDVVDDLNSEIDGICSETNVCDSSESLENASKKQKLESENEKKNKHKKKKKDRKSSKDHKNKKKLKGKPNKTAVKINEDVETYSKLNASLSDFGVQSNVAVTQNIAEDSNSEIDENLINVVSNLKDGICSETKVCDSSESLKKASKKQKLESEKKKKNKHKKKKKKKKSSKDHKNKKKRKSKTDKTADRLNEENKTNSKLDVPALDIGVQATDTALENVAKDSNSEIDKDLVSVVSNPKNEIYNDANINRDTEILEKTLRKQKLENEKSEKSNHKKKKKDIKSSKDHKNKKFGESTKNKEFETCLELNKSDIDQSNMLGKGMKTKTSVKTFKSHKHKKKSKEMSDAVEIGKGLEILSNLATSDVDEKKKSKSLKRKKDKKHGEKNISSKNKATADFVDQCTVEPVNDFSDSENIDQIMETIQKVETQSNLSTYALSDQESPESEVEISHTTETETKQSMSESRTKEPNHIKKLKKKSKEKKVSKRKKVADFDHPGVISPANFSESKNILPQIDNEKIKKRRKKSSEKKLKKSAEFIESEESDNPDTITPVENLSNSEDNKYDDNINESDCKKLKRRDKFKVSEAKNSLNSVSEDICYKSSRKETAIDKNKVQSKVKKKKLFNNDLFCKTIANNHIESANLSSFNKQSLLNNDSLKLHTEDTGTFFDEMIESSTPIANSNFSSSEETTAFSDVSISDILKYKRVDIYRYNAALGIEDEHTSKTTKNKHQGNLTSNKEKNDLLIASKKILQQSYVSEPCKSPDLFDENSVAKEAENANLNTKSTSFHSTNIKESFVDSTCVNGNNVSKECESSAALISKHNDEVQSTNIFQQSSLVSENHVSKVCKSTDVLNAKDNDELQSTAVFQQSSLVDKKHVSKECESTDELNTKDNNEAQSTAVFQQINVVNGNRVSNKRESTAVLIAKHNNEIQSTAVFQESNEDTFWSMDYLSENDLKAINIQASSEYSFSSFSHSSLNPSVVLKDVLQSKSAQQHVSESEKLFSSSSESDNEAQRNISFQTAINSAINVSQLTLENIAKVNELYGENRDAVMNYFYTDIKCKSPTSQNVSTEVNDFQPPSIDYFNTNKNHISLSLRNESTSNRIGVTNFQTPSTNNFGADKNHTSSSPQTESTSNFQPPSIDYLYTDKKCDSLSSQNLSTSNHLEEPNFPSPSLIQSAKNSNLDEFQSEQQTNSGSQPLFNDHIIKDQADEYGTQYLNAENIYKNIRSSTETVNPSELKVICSNDNYNKVSSVQVIINFASSQNEDGSVIKRKPFVANFDFQTVNNSARNPLTSFFLNAINSSPIIRDHYNQNIEPTENRKSCVSSNRATNFIDESVNFDQRSHIDNFCTTEKTGQHMSLNDSGLTQTLCATSSPTIVNNSRSKKTLFNNSFCKDNALLSPDRNNAPLSSDVNKPPSSPDINNAPLSSDIDSAPSSPGTNNAPLSSDIDSAPSSPDTNNAALSSDVNNPPSSPDTNNAPLSSDINNPPSSPYTNNTPLSQDINLKHLTKENLDSLNRESSELYLETKVNNNDSSYRTSTIYTDESDNNSAVSSALSYSDFQGELSVGETLEIGTPSKTSSCQRNKFQVDSESEGSEISKSEPTIKDQRQVEKSLKTDNNLTKSTSAKGKTPRKNMSTVKRSYNKSKIICSKADGVKKATANQRKTTRKNVLPVKRYKKRPARGPHVARFYFWSGPRNLKSLSKRAKYYQLSPANIMKAKECTETDGDLNKSTSSTSRTPKKSATPKTPKKSATPKTPRKNKIPVTCTYNLRQRKSLQTPKPLDDFEDSAF